MASVTVRIGDTAHQTLQDLARQMGTSMQSVLEKASMEYQRKCFLEGRHADFAALRNNPKAWQEEQEERAVWEATLSDGLGEL
ncbi:MAG: toxin-antitoxin system protein [Deltaproteobacteria bacterium]|nr:toxin-antitoxin system protein [Deltaproteobacteria bacterium]